MTKMATLIIPVGISGSGKSTWIKNYVLQHPEFSIVSPDELRMVYGNDVNDQSVNAKVWYIAKQKIIFYLQEGENVILDALNIDRSQRKNFLKQISSEVFNFKTIGVVFPCDVKISNERIRNDIAQKKNRADVDLLILKKMEAKYKGGIDTVSQEFDEVIFI